MKDIDVSEPWAFLSETETFVSVTFEQFRSHTSALLVPLCVFHSSHSLPEHAAVLTILFMISALSQLGISMILENLSSLKPCSKISLKMIAQEAYCLHKHATTHHLHIKEFKYSLFLFASLERRAGEAPGTVTFTLNSQTKIDSDKFFSFSSKQTAASL